MFNWSVNLTAKLSWEKELVFYKIIINSVMHDFSDIFENTARTEIGL